MYCNMKETKVVYYKYAPSLDQFQNNGEVYTIKSFVELYLTIRKKDTFYPTYCRINDNTLEIWQEQNHREIRDDGELRTIYDDRLVGKIEFNTVFYIDKFFMMISEPGEEYNPSVFENWRTVYINTKKELKEQLNKDLTSQLDDIRKTISNI